jgi:SAM-dependent methyltransferase
MSIIDILTKVSSNLNSKHIYELSAHGALFKYLQKNAGVLTYSEYFNDTVCGEYKNGIECQSVENLTYGNCVFDICTSTEVFEHVDNDIKGFSEILRVLKPNGIFVFTVPLSNGSTIERDFLSPQYHYDLNGKVLVYRNYGRDILDRLVLSGFTKAEILDKQLPWNYVVPVIIAYK